VAGEGGDKKEKRGKVRLENAVDIAQKYPSDQKKSRQRRRREITKRNGGFVRGRDRKKKGKKPLKHLEEASGDAAEKRKTSVQKASPEKRSGNQTLRLQSETARNREPKNLQSQNKRSVKGEKNDARHASKEKRHKARSRGNALDREDAGEQRRA